MIEVGDFGEILSDDTVHALQLLDAPGAQEPECCSLSQHAVSGEEAPSTIRLRAQVGDQFMLLLVDSGSTHSFISEAFTQRVSAKTEALPPVSVRVANGQRLHCNKIVRNLAWQVPGHTFHTDLRVLPLDAYDGVLGMDWLSAHSPMNCHWQLKTIAFETEGKTVQLQGVRTTDLPPISELDAYELHRMEVANDIWTAALVTVEPAVKENTEPIPSNIQKVLSEYQDVFAEPTVLPPRRQYDHGIHLEPGTTPINTKPYRYSPAQKDEIEKQVHEMLQSGVITHSMSPYAAPVLLVKKKDSSWRFCVDFRRLNSATVKNKFPLPVVDELLDELAGAQYFSKIDLRAGYHQIRMREENEEKTAFKTHHGHYHFRVMPFGLCNAPATFQCLMNSVFGRYVRKFIIIFLDDILVFSADLQEHEQHLRLTLDLLREHQLFAKATKCSFAQTSIEYLGHVISKDGVATDTSKTSAMQAWPVPSTPTELRGFLGLTGYYRKFVPHYGIIAKPLTQLLTKKGFTWNDKAQQAFDMLKQAMVSTPVLALPDFARPFAIETDACDTGVGAVLTQDGHPVAYLSKALGVRNQKLSTYEKEFLAVMMAIDKWQPYLQRAPFEIVTDHKSLCALGDQQLATDLQRKAMSKMVGLQFSFRYKKGSDNGAADALSRVGHLLALDALSLCQPQWLQEVANSYETNPDSQDLLAKLAITTTDDQGRTLQNGVIRQRGRLWIGANSALQTKLVAALHHSAVGGHPGATATYHRVRKLFAWPGLKRAVEDFVKQCAVCQHAKHEHTHPAGKLQPLPIPKEPWQDLTMDFVEGLPKSEGYDAIMVVVDRLTKYAHFVPLRHPFTAAQVARAFWEHVIKLHGVPHTIVSDLDKIFTSAMWRELLAAAGTKLFYSTAYHPQTDGQTERVNQVLLKLQPYTQSSVANRPCRKLSYKFFGPFMVTERIGALAYRLQLPPDSRIHPVFHVSQLKPFTPDYTPVFSELPRVPDLAGGETEPVAILERRMMKKGDVPVVQLHVQWANMPPSATTWEDYDVLRQRYPAACIWEGAPSQEGGNVAPADAATASAAD